MHLFMEAPVKVDGIYYQESLKRVRPEKKRAMDEESRGEVSNAV